MTIKRLLAGVVYLGALVIGFGIYVVSKKTPAFAYQGMIKLFCLTGGYSNDWLF